MILTGPEIEREWRNGRIWISPYHEDQLQPNSYDFRLGPELLVYTETVLDIRKDNACERIPIPDAGFVLRPDRIYLGHTVEVMGSDTYVPIIRGRSSIARLGLFVHVTADLVNIGSCHQFTLQLHAIEPVRVFRDMRVGQVTFWCTMGERVMYQGHYLDSRGPVPSRAWMDRGKSDEEPPEDTTG